jgi:hypothetical protein
MEKENEYSPSHAELEKLDIFKEVANVFPGTEWTTGSSAYSRGTRTLAVPTETSQYTYSVYPKKGTVISSDGYTTASKLDLSSIHGWEKAIFRMLVSSLTNLAKFGRIVRPSKKVLNRMLELPRNSLPLKNYLIQNPDTPTDVIVSIIKADKYGEVYNSSLNNPKIPVEVLDLVFDRIVVSQSEGHRSPLHFERLIEHPNTTSRIIEKVFNRIKETYPKVVKREMLDRELHDRNLHDRVLKTIIESPKTSEEVLSQVISLNSKLIPYAIKHPNFPKWASDWMI